MGVVGDFSNQDPANDKKDKVEWNKHQEKDPGADRCRASIHPQSFFLLSAGEHLLDNIISLQNFFFRDYHS
jgi:hypothetical protein